MSKILLELTFDSSSVYKIYETPTSQIMRVIQQQQQAIIPGNLIPPPQNIPQNIDAMDVDVDCGNCHHKNKIHAGLGKPAKFKLGFAKFPADNKIKCVKCGNEINLLGLRQQVEAQFGKKIF